LWHEVRSRYLSFQAAGKELKMSEGNLERPVGVLLWLTVALGGCHADMRSPVANDAAGTTGAVSFTAVVAPSSGSYKLKRSEHAFGAQPIVRDSPVYPASLIDRQLPPVTVHAKAVLDEQGRVTEVRDIDGASTPDHAAFFAACQAAIKRWQFSPMTVVEESDDGKGNISQVRKNAPFSLDYAFRFELVAGKPVVSPQQ
jgi:hypothetical protein